MRGLGKYVLAALLIAVLSHLAYVHAVPRVLMAVAMNRIAAGEFNAWRFSDRVTPASRAIVRPSPDFAYSACSYDLSGGPITINVADWGAYWSLSLYAANSDNFFVIDDREVESGVNITLTRDAPDHDAEEAVIRIVESPSTRGIALIRRLAPTQDAYDDAAQVAQGDACTAQTP